jgi:hypothetical protein
MTQPYSQPNCPSQAKQVAYSWYDVHSQPMDEQIARLTQGIKQIRLQFHSHHPINAPNEPQYKPLSCSSQDGSLVNLHEQVRQTETITMCEIEHVENAYKENARTLHELRVLRQIYDQPQLVVNIVSKRI